MTSGNPKPTDSRLVKLLVFWLISNKPDLCFHFGGEHGGDYFPVYFRRGELIHYESVNISQATRLVCN